MNYSVTDFCPIHSDDGAESEDDSSSSPATKTKTSDPNGSDLSKIIHNNEKKSEMLKFDMNFFNLASKIAESNPTRFGYKFSAILVHKNKVVSVGSNVEKSHPFAAKFGRNKDALYWHAETHAIYNAYKNDVPKNVFRKSTLYVVRYKRLPKYVAAKVGKEHIYGVAKPCPGCMQCIDIFEIPRIVYSVDEDSHGKGFEVMKRG